MGDYNLTKAETKLIKKIYTKRIISYNESDYSKYYNLFNDELIERHFDTQADEEQGTYRAIKLSNKGKRVYEQIVSNKVNDKLSRGISITALAIALLSFTISLLTFICK